MNNSAVFLSNPLLSHRQAKAPCYTHHATLILNEQEEYPQGEVVKEIWLKAEVVKKIMALLPLRFLISFLPFT
jgi:hypothetical protein